MFVPGCVYISVYRHPLSKMENFAWSRRVGHTPYNGLRLYFQHRKGKGNTTMGPGNTLFYILQRLHMTRVLFTARTFLCVHCHVLNHINRSLNTIQS